jgi:hypothetical protein
VTATIAAWFVKITGQERDDQLQQLRADLAGTVGQMLEQERSREVS